MTGLLITVLGCTNSPHKQGSVDDSRPDSGDLEDNDLVLSFRERAYERGQLLGEFPELWGLFLDIESMREHVENWQLTFDAIPDEELPQQYFRMSFKLNTSCSLYQLGVAADPDGIRDEVDSGMRLIMEEGNWEPVFNALLFSAALSGRINQDIVTWFAEKERENLAEIVSAGGSGLSLSEPLARYLITTAYFQVPVDEELVDLARTTIFSGDEVLMRDTLDQQLLYDLMSAYRLGIEPDLDQFKAVLAASWDNEHHYQLSDCATGYCQMKAFQLLARIDFIFSVFDEARMTELAAYHLASVGEDGAFLFPGDFGLEPDSLWHGESGCDNLCSPRHWAVTMGVNHLLHRLDELNALDALSSRIDALRSEAGDSTDAP